MANQSVVTFWPRCWSALPWRRVGKDHTDRELVVGRRTGERIMTIATRILSEFLLFSCMCAFVTAVVLAAASLLI
jgi:hypothetical protein